MWILCVSITTVTSVELQQWTRLIWRWTNCFYIWQQRNLLSQARNYFPKLVPLTSTLRLRISAQIIHGLLSRVWKELQISFQKAFDVSNYGGIMNTDVDIEVPWRYTLRQPFHGWIVSYQFCVCGDNFVYLTLEGNQIEIYQKCVCSQSMLRKSTYNEVRLRFPGMDNGDIGIVTNMSVVLYHL